MRTMLMDTMYTAIKQTRTRWVFLVTFAVAIGLLVLAYSQQSVALAAVAAVATFMAGEEKGSQVFCNDCAVSLTVDPEVPEYTFQA